MNKFIDWIISSLKYIGEKSKLFMTQFYNEIRSLINSNFELNKMYKPIMKEKKDINNQLQKTLQDLEHKNKEAQNHIKKLESENELQQSKISIIQDLLTKRHD
jgi:hypothetical protein